MPVWVDLAVTGIVKQAGVLVALVGSIGTGIWAAERHYVTRELLAGEVRPLKLQYLEQRDDTLARRIFELREAERQRPLSAFEREELDRLIRQHERVQRELRQLLEPPPNE